MERITFDKEANKETFKRLALPLQFAVEAEGEGSKVKGYVAVWDVISTDRGGFFAVFPKGSMVLPNYDVTLQYNHNDDWLIATESNGTLVVGVDETGVPISAVLDNTFLDQYIATKVAKGTIKGMSVGMYPLEYHREKRVVTDADVAGNSELAPYLGKEVEVEIYDRWLMDEVTITGRPAFPQTTLENYAKEKGNKGESVETNNTYIVEAQLMSLDLED